MMVGFRFTKPKLQFDCCVKTIDEIKINDSSHFRIEFSPDRCAAPGLSAETILATFSRTCYEFHVTRGESYDKAQQVCKSHGKSIEDDLNFK